MPYQTSTPLYYRLSGKFSFVGVLVSLLVGCAAAVPLAFAYSYASVYSPIAGWVTILLTGGFAFGIGYITGRMLKQFKTRNKMIALSTTVVTTSFAYYLAWAVLIFALVQRANNNSPPDDQVNITFWDVVTSPSLMWEAIKEVNASGYYTIKNHTPSGIELTILWTIEFFLIYGIALYSTMSQINRFPFCEHCQKWGVIKPLITTATGDDMQVRSALEQRDFSVIERLGPSSGNTFYSVSLQGCPDCDTTQTLCLDRTSVTIDNKGNAKSSERRIVHRLTLSPEDVVSVATATAGVGAAAAAPPPDAAATAEPAETHPDAPASEQASSEPAPPDQPPPPAA